MSAEFNRAWDAVDKVCDLIKGHYSRIEVAGSLRRCKINPKDGEIVVIPTATLWPRLDELVKAGTLAKAKYGLKETFRWDGKNAAYRGVDVDGLKVEIFCAKPETWGYIYWLRTGPGDANQYVMRQMDTLGVQLGGGGLPDFLDFDAALAKDGGDVWGGACAGHLDLAQHAVMADGVDTAGVIDGDGHFFGGHGVIPRCK